jgi:phospholipid transport system substrate-binding protein
MSGLSSRPSTSGCANNRRIENVGAKSFIAPAVISAILSLVASTAWGTTPAEFVRAAGDRTFQSLGNGALTDAERQRRFRVIVADVFDLPAIGQFVLGRYWRTSTATQKTEYLKLFEDFVVQAYAGRFKELSEKKFIVGLAQPVTDEDTLVQSQIIELKGPPIKVNWCVRRVPQGFKVVDVQVEGISMSITQRDEFAAVIQSSGGKVEGLISALRKKTGASN